MQGGPGFVHLHVHSAYSLREGALSVEALAKLAVADKMPALAITDTNNLFGALEFSEYMSKNGVQPIIGLQANLNFADAASLGMRQELSGAGTGAIVLLAKSELGYANLMKIASKLHLEADPSEGPALHLERLDGLVDGLIALSGGTEGAISPWFGRERPEMAIGRLARLHKLFGDRLFIELQRHDTADERASEAALIDYAYQHSLGLVATNEPYFASQRDYEAHDALICIAQNSFLSAQDRRQLTPKHSFLPRADMLKLFSDLPEACANTVEIARACAFRPKPRKPILPNFTALDGTALDEVGELQKQALEGLTHRLATNGMAKGLTLEDYQHRLEFELEVITKMKFPGYFLIVADFIRYAKREEIPVGPGRGSGAGSLVAYSLQITDLDPLRFGLLFERFLNPERISMPDFDIDFCQDRREEVIAYVRERYGRDRVAQIITFGSFLARGVMRNVGRVLEMPLGQVDKLAKLVPQNPAKPMKLVEAIATETRLREAAESEPKIARMLTIAQTLEGLLSNASTHAAGIVIGDRPLDQLVPLYRDPKSDMPATQFNMKWVEAAGLVKFDFLGLKTLTVLAKAVDLLKNRKIYVNLSAIPLDDKLTFELLGRGETVGVFQLESAGMRKALVEMRADRFEDIIALVALYRPGPMENIPTYCARKLGEEDPEYYHPLIQPVLQETFGVIIYQEQVMQIAQTLSGYSLGEADVLRRAMGKKIKREMDAQRERFVEGALKRDLKSEQANEIFDLLAKFADYGFNKSHAAAYALIAYQTAWFKANHPVEFMAASMSLDCSNTDKLAEFRNEALRMGIAVSGPCVNRSGKDFEVHKSVGDVLSIRYALSAVKGVGEGQAKAIVASRHSGPFKSLADFGRRVNPHEINKRVVETLAAAGGFDAIEPSRARVCLNVETILGLGAASHADAVSGQNALFDVGESDSVAWVQAKEWQTAERMKREFDAVGFFLSGHPLDDYAGVMKRMRLVDWRQFVHSVRHGAAAGRLAAVVLERTERRTKTGNKMGIVTLSDASGQYEAIMFQEGLDQFRDVLEKGALVIVSLQANLDGEEVRARIINVEALEPAAARVQKGVRIFVRDASALDLMHDCLSAQSGGGNAGRDGNGTRESAPLGEVSVILMLGSQLGEVEMRLPNRFPVTSRMTGALKALPGIVSVEAV